MLSIYWALDTGIGINLTVNRNDYTPSIIQIYINEHFCGSSWCECIFVRVCVHALWEEGEVCLSLSCVKSAQFLILTSIICQSYTIKISLFLRSMSTPKFLSFILWWNANFPFIKWILYFIILNSILSKTLHLIRFRALNISA